MGSFVELEHVLAAHGRRSHMVPSVDRVMMKQAQYARGLKTEVSVKFKHNSWYQKAVKKTWCVLSQLNRTVESKRLKVILFKAFSDHAWLAVCRHANRILREMRKFWKTFSVYVRMRHMGYERRLRELGFFPMKGRKE